MVKKKQLMLDHPVHVLVLEKAHTLRRSGPILLNYWMNMILMVK